MKEWDNGEGQIFFSAEETCSVIKQYYKEYEGFNGKICIETYSKSYPDGWGFYDYYGKMDLVFEENLKICNKEIVKTSRIKYENIQLLKIFEPYFEDSDYELTGRSISFNVSGYGEKVEFKGVNLYVKRKDKQKQLTK